MLIMDFKYLYETTGTHRGAPLQWNLNLVGADPCVGLWIGMHAQIMSPNQGCQK